MNKEYIEFKKERDLGSIISDAFKFIRLEGKEFFLTILKVTIIPIVLVLVSALFLTFLMSDIPNEGVFDTITFGGVGLLFMFAYLMVLIFINLAAMYYIKSYIDNNGLVNEKEVRENVMKKFWSFTGMSILMFLIFMASLMFCLLPAIYTYPVLSLTASIFVYENLSATGAIGKSFNFINGHFWETLGVIIVVGILVGVLGYVFQIPAMIYQFAKLGISLGNDDPASMFNSYSDPIYLFLYTVSIVAQLMFHTLTIIANVFLYFDINEQKNLTGTIERIDSIGQ